jgi:hypothetical protein
MYIMSMRYISCSNLVDFFLKTIRSCNTYSDVFCGDESTTPSLRGRCCVFHLLGYTII